MMMMMDISLPPSHLFVYAFKRAAWANTLKPCLAYLSKFHGMSCSLQWRLLALILPKQAMIIRILSCLLTYASTMSRRHTCYAQMP